jgi:hypothetical protein
MPELGNKLGEWNGVGLNNKRHLSADLEKS